MTDMVIWTIRHLARVLAFLVLIVWAAAFGPILRFTTDPPPAFDAFVDSTAGHVTIVLIWIAFVAFLFFVGRRIWRAEFKKDLTQTKD